MRNFAISIITRLPIITIQMGARFIRWSIFFGSCFESKQFGSIWIDLRDTTPNHVINGCAYVCPVLKLPTTPISETARAAFPWENSNSFIEYSVITLAAGHQTLQKMANIWAIINDSQWHAGARITRDEFNIDCITWFDFWFYSVPFYMNLFIYMFS